MSKPFSRALAIVAALAAASQAFDPQAALAGVPIYRSRGKGKGGGQPARSYNKAGKYTPHQGARECARRIRQGVNHG